MRTKEKQHSSHSFTRLTTLSFTSPHSPCHTCLALQHSLSSRRHTALPLAPRCHTAVSLVPRRHKSPSLLNNAHIMFSFEYRSKCLSFRLNRSFRRDFTEKTSKTLFSRKVQVKRQENVDLLSFLQLTRTVLDFTGPSELADCLKDVNVVVIPAGVPRKHAVADNCPNAFIHIINNPVNSAVPIAAQVLKKKEFQELTVRDSECWNWGRDAKAGAGSATLSIAYAAARFVESSLRALDGDGDVYECSFVESDLQGLTEYEHKALEALKPELKASIDKGIAFANKPAN
ncbi:hypothetical protein F2Q68_00004397 [Brassica cretica]|uniref:malate dehydrogenase n=2 Tax=Brassica cretica TaxID=69181 RepID=A0ABQ7CLX3_BRACR|nr:hypothetical protein F2Q68_00004397 [Brassica cretica]KAF3552541.1 hypothetical protein DY000_02006425 [Brassica cretica]